MILFSLWYNIIPVTIYLYKSIHYRPLHSKYGSALLQSKLINFGYLVI